MNLDGPRESGSMSMDIDNDAVFHDRHDSVEMDSPEPSGGPPPFGFYAPNHELAGPIPASIHCLPGNLPPDYDRRRGSDHSPQFMVLASSSSPEEVGNIYQNQWLAGQHRSIPPGLKPPVPEVTSRKRKRSLDLPHTYTTDHNDISHANAFADSASSQPRRRTRPRLRAPKEGEFSPLLIMSPGGERGTSPEETISVFRFSPPPNVTHPSHAIHRYFDILPEHGPRTLQSGSFPEVDDQEHPKEFSRSNSASSYAEVALASTAPRNPSLLSTLTDFSLPRPFENDHPSLSGSNQAVHQRFDAPLTFFSTSGGRMGGLRASCEPVGSSAGALGQPIRPSSHEHGAHAGSPRPALRPLEPSTIILDKPLCESPEEMDPSVDGLIFY